MAKLLFFSLRKHILILKIRTFLLIFARKKLVLMNLNLNWPNVILTICIIVILLSLMYNFIKDNKSSKKSDYVDDDRDYRLESRKLIVPLRIQAYERLLLYVERIQFPVLVKRVFCSGMSRNDFQFSLLQNVQDEFEHNLAQRLYVSEDTWHLILLSKEEVMQNINAVFNDNPDVDVALIAQQIASFNNPMVEKAVINIKIEFNSL